MSVQSLFTRKNIFSLVVVFALMFGFASSIHAEFYRTTGDTDWGFGYGYGYGLGYGWDGGYAAGYRTGGVGAPDFDGYGYGYGYGLAYDQDPDILAFGEGNFNMDETQLPYIFDAGLAVPAGDDPSNTNEITFKENVHLTVGDDFTIYINRNNFFGSEDFEDFTGFQASDVVDTSEIPEGYVVVKAVQIGLTDAALISDPLSMNIENIDSEYEGTSLKTFHKEPGGEWELLDFLCDVEEGSCSVSFGAESSYAFVDEIPYEFTEGDGSEEDPYQIDSCEGLETMGDHSGLYFSLTEDLVCEDFHTIGGQDYFSAYLEGNNHSIEYTLDVGESDTYAGLFGRFNAGWVRNLILSGTITVSDTENHYIGFLAGHSTGGGMIISNVHVVDATITGTFNDATIAAGIVGYTYYGAETLITKSSFRGDIINTTDGGSDAGLAGLIGQGLPITIRDSYSAGTLVSDGAGLAGGLIALGSGSITRSYSSMVLTNVEAVGGLVGYAYGNVDIVDSFSAASFPSGIGGEELAAGVVVNDGSGSFTLDNVFYDQYLFNATSTYTCANDGGAEGCAVINPDGSVPAYFKSNSANPPLDEWDFETIWQTVEGDYPELIGTLVGDEVDEPEDDDDEEEPAPEDEEEDTDSTKSGHRHSSAGSSPKIKVTPSGTIVTTDGPITTSTGGGSSTVTTPVRDLTLGLSGTDVKWLQEFLIAQNKGTAALALKNVGATAYFGTYTRDALAEYQRIANIVPAVGYFGPLTRAYLKSIGTIGIWW